MEQPFQITVIALIILILIIVWTTSRRARKFDSSHADGVFKAGFAVRGAAVFTLLCFCAVGFLSLKSMLDETTGLVLMAVFFVLWLPSQLFLYTYIFINEEGLVYFRPIGEDTAILWDDIKSASPSRFGSILIKTEDRKLRIYPFFSGFDRIKEEIGKH